MGFYHVGTEYLVNINLKFLGTGLVGIICLVNNIFFFVKKKKQSKTKDLIVFSHACHNTIYECLFLCITKKCCIDDLFVYFHVIGG